MNLHKPVVRNGDFERSLEISLKKWGAQAAPPLGSRARLLRSAKDLQNTQPASLLQITSIFRYLDVGPNDLSMFYSSWAISYLSVRINY